MKTTIPLPRFFRSGFFSILFIAFFSLLSFPASAQWHWCVTSQIGIGDGLIVNGPNLYYGATHGVDVSTDNGDTWTHMNNGLPPGEPRILELFIQGSTLIASTAIAGVYRYNNNSNTWVQTSTAWMPSFALKDGILYSAGANGTVYVSADTGNTWSSVNIGLGNTLLRSVCVSGNSIFAATNGLGVYRSDDNGSTWTVVNNGLTNLTVYSLAANGTNLFAGTYGGGVFLSTDNGDHWNAVNNGLLNLNIRQIAVNGSYLFAACPGGLNPAIYLSVDNGNTWIDTGFGGNCYSMAFSNTYVFAGDVNNGVFRRLLSDLTSTVTGTITYKNNLNTPITNTQVFLKRNGNVVAQTTTDNSGNYSFNNLVPGTYGIECNITKPWGGVNAGSALLVLKNFLGLMPLTGINARAADADGSHYVNSGDAMLIAKRFVGMLNNFAVGDWIIDPVSVEVTSSGITTANLDVLCTGDVDGSYVPPL